MVERVRPDSTGRETRGRDTRRETDSASKRERATKRERDKERETKRERDREREKSFQECTRASIPFATFCVCVRERERERESDMGVREEGECVLDVGEVIDIIV